MAFTGVIEQAIKNMRQDLVRAIAHKDLLWPQLIVIRESLFELFGIGRWIV